MSRQRVQEIIGELREMKESFEGGAGLSPKAKSDFATKLISAFVDEFSGTTQDRDPMENEIWIAMKLYEKNGKYYDAVPSAFRTEEYADLAKRIWSYRETEKPTDAKKDWAVFDAALEKKLNAEYGMAESKNVDVAAAILKKLVAACDDAWGALAGSMTGAGTERFEDALDLLREKETLSNPDDLADALNELYFGADEILFKADIRNEKALEEFSKHWDKAFKHLDALRKLTLKK